MGHIGADTEPMIPSQRHSSEAVVQLLAAQTDPNHRNALLSEHGKVVWRYISGVDHHRQFYSTAGRLPDRLDVTRAHITGKTMPGLRGKRALAVAYFTQINACICKPRCNNPRLLVSEVKVISISAITQGDVENFYVRHENLQLSLWSNQCA
ncbi:hypothetical protein ALP75_203732 [Pseudomonas syringae pv. actinidiae]|nr:hypothetical protein ALP75_203732 [Pseudomonas syringae pv. actinidiae]